MTDQISTPLMLYVEDEAIIQLMMKDILEDAGFELIIASNGEEALDILEAEKSRITALVTDVNLGTGPTGWNVARRARMLIPRIPVLYASSASEHDWMMYGVPLSRRLSKPFRASRVVETVSALLEALPDVNSQTQCSAPARLSRVPDDVRATLLARQSAIARVSQSRNSERSRWLQDA